MFMISYEVLVHEVVRLSTGSKCLFMKDLFMKYLFMELFVYAGGWHDTI